MPCVARLDRQLAERRDRRAAVEACGDEIGVAEEVGDRERLRLLVDGARSRVLHDAAVVQDRDDVGERQRLVLVVGHEDDRRAERCEQLLDLGAQAVAQARVERGERLVEQDQARLRRERPGHRDALLLAARELVGPAMAEAAEADQVEQLGHPLPAPAPPRQPEADVLGDVEVREEQALLRHVADAPAVRRHVVLAVVERLADEHDPPAVGPARSRRSGAAAWSCRIPRARARRRSRRPARSGRRRSARPSTRRTWRRPGR